MARFHRGAPVRFQASCAVLLCLAVPGSWDSWQRSARAETPPDPGHAVPPRAVEHTPSSYFPPTTTSPHLRDLRAQVYRLPNGTETRLSQEARGPTLLNFWATWCEPCVREMPRLVGLHERYRHNVRFLGIAHHLNTPRNRKEVELAAASAHLDWPQYLESDGNAVEAQVFGNGVSAMPAFVLFDKEGKALLMFIGSIDSPDNYSKLVAALEAVDGGSKTPSADARKRK